MTTTGLCWVLSLLSLVTPVVDAGSVLTFRGQMVAVKGAADDSRKSFELTLLVAKTDRDGAEVYWTVEEQGHGSWSWPDRVGKLSLDARWQGGDVPGPSLLYDRGDGKSVVPIPLPFLTANSPLQKDFTWEQGKLEHKVVSAEPRGDRSSWKVEARNAYGVRRTTWVDQQSPVVLATRERVFIGQGQEHELKLELTDVRALSGDSLTETITGFSTLITLVEKLQRAPRSPQTEWNEEQLTALRAEQPLLAKLVKLPLLTTVARAAEQDTSNQKNRSGAVASLRDKALANSALALKLTGVAGAEFDSTANPGKITVLHFWEYRDAPLEEPYGQTGYLDFLQRKFGKQGVQFYGVAVYDPAAGGGDAASNRRAALQSANRFKQFMNLSYPLLSDDGSALKKIGDPRVAGAKLPLFLVLAPGGKVLEYHSGNYEVRRDRGLEELEAILTKQIEQTTKKP
ncbi:MAG: TlpA family protein disulfide reductase [Planctomycetota bacterium]